MRKPIEAPTQETANLIALGQLIEAVAADDSLEQSPSPQQEIFVIGMVIGNSNARIWSESLLN